jgi:hypothetical protein
MPNILVMIFIGFDVVFAACGGLLMGFSLISEQTKRGSPTLDNVARNLLLDQCPLTGTIIPYWELTGRSRGIMAPPWRHLSYALIMKLGR